MTTARLDGRGIIVTGAGGGLGRAYALAAAAAGGLVVVNDVDPVAAASAVEEIRGLGGQAIASPGSVADWEIAARLTADCLSAFGRVDGLVANAAIHRTAAPWDETEEGLRAINAVNVLGVQFTARHAMRAMVDAGRGGAVVTVVSGAQHGITGMSAYGASKGAVNAMTVNWALAGREHGIRVNAISPLGRTAMSAADLRADVPDFPEPAEIAPVVVALLSDATAGVTGRIVRFDGTRLGRYDTALAPIAEAGAGTWAPELAAEALTAAFADPQDRPRA